MAAFVRGVGKHLCKFLRFNRKESSRRTNDSVT